MKHKEDPKLERPQFSEMRLRAIGNVAKMIVARCVRYTSIEPIHQGRLPCSKTGDYSDVKVVDPFQEIPWNELGRITQEEMKRFTKEAVNKMFTVLVYLEANREIPVGRHAFHSPHDWDDAEIDPYIEKIFNRTAEQEDDQEGGAPT